MTHIWEADVAFPDVGHLQYLCSWSDLKPFVMQSHHSYNLLKAVAVVTPKCNLQMATKFSCLMTLQT